MVDFQRMLTVRSAAELRQIVRSWQISRSSVALVPTMGNLHEGHLALVTAADSARVDRIVVSIFVNPMQFDCPEDLRRYPRTIRDDVEKIDDRADVLFIPSTEEMFPRGHLANAYVEIPWICDILEGGVRPRHFRGVATIISKLLNLIQPQIICLGEKDFQQLVVVRRLIGDLNYAVRVLEVPTVRDARGLALSSRNRHLGAEEQQIAPALYQTMIFLARKIKSGMRDTAELLRLAADQLTAVGFSPELLSIVDPVSLGCEPRLAVGKEYRILCSARLGQVRLVDNLKITV